MSRILGEMRARAACAPSFGSGTGIAELDKQPYEPGKPPEQKEMRMRTQQIGLGAVLLGFSALTAYTVYQHGYIGFFELMMANAATVTAGVDLVIALGLIVTWMGKDAQERGISSIPYILLTLALGSVGPLLYLIRRAGGEHTRPAPVSAQQARI